MPSKPVIISSKIKTILFSLQIFCTSEENFFKILLHGNVPQQLRSPLES